MSELVIADSSCLIGLSKIGQLTLLHDLFGEIWIPPAVYHETVIQGAGKPGSEVIKAAEWIICKPVHNQLSVKTLQVNQLGLGECEAIILSLEQAANFLILDDRKARKVALAMELPVIGTVAILHKATQKCFINDLPETLKQLEKVGFRFVDQYENKQ